MVQRAERAIQTSKIKPSYHRKRRTPYKSWWMSPGTWTADCQRWKAKESSIPRSLWRCQTGSDNEPKKRPERGEYEASEAEFTCRNMEPTRFIKFRIRRRFRANPMVAFLQGAMRKRRLPDWPRPLIPIGRGLLSQHRKFHIFERPNPG